MMTIKTVHDVLYDFREAENELMNVRMVFLNVSRRLRGEISNALIRVWVGFIRVWMSFIRAGVRFIKHPKAIFKNLGQQAEAMM